MGRYLGPKNCIIKSLGNLPGLKVLKPIQNIENKKVTKLKKVTKKKSDYGLRLQEKQKIRYNYGISEPQLYRYIKKIQYLAYRTKNDLLQLIELRLDNIVFNLGFTITIASARQLINHGKIYVNSNRITIASFNCKINDIIFFKRTTQKKILRQLSILKTVKIPNYLIKVNSCTGIIKTNIINQFKLQIDERLVFEFYSKQ